MRLDQRVNGKESTNSLASGIDLDQSQAIAPVFSTASAAQIELARTGVKALQRYHCRVIVPWSGCMEKDPLTRHVRRDGNRA
jgi:hypothetical protein